MHINRVEPLSAAKVAGMLYAILGLLFGAMFSLIAMAGVMAPGSDASAAMGAVFGVGAIVMFPILYGCFGFVITLLMAALFNLTARMVGGVEIEVT